MDNSEKILYEAKILLNRLEAMQKYFDLKFDSEATARCVALQAMDKRLEGMNEIKAMAAAQASTYITRNEIAILLDKINTQIDTLRQSKAFLEGKADMSAVYVSAAFGLVGIIIGVISIFTR